MATKKSHSLRNILCNGTFGNLNKGFGEAVFTADPIGTVIQTLRLDGGTQLTGLTAHTEALGASTTIDIGYQYVDESNGAAEPTKFAAASATVSAGKVVWDGKPVTFEYPVYLTVTVKGGAGTGEVTLVPEYIYRGTK